jgi:transcriptional regulator with XRE-family HTH domain
MKAQPQPNECENRLEILGRHLRELREGKGISRKEVMVALGKNIDSTQVLRRYEIGTRKASREDLIAIVVRGLKETDPRTINLILKEAGYQSLGSDEIGRFGLPSKVGQTEPEAQKVRWGPVDGRPAGILIVSPFEAFIPWTELKREGELKLINQLGRLVPPGCNVALKEFKGRKDWLVRILSPETKPIGDVWFGPDPEKVWTFDGMVRVGSADVWQVFQRFSDGSYRRIKAKHW